MKRHERRRPAAVREMFANVGYLALYFVAALMWAGHLMS